MNLSTILSNTVKMFKQNSPEILTALGVSGVITTSYLTAKASYKSAEIIDWYESLGDPDPDPKERFKNRTKMVWKNYIPAGVSGVVTIGCIIASSKAGNRRTAAAVTAYSVTERAFSEYREKVVEQIGKGKEQRIRDDLAQEKVTKDPHTSKEVVVLGNGHVLCCELFTHRYFKSDMETLRKAQNDINMRVVNHIYVTLDEFYDALGLPHTSVSGSIGWTSDKLMELVFTTTMSEEGEPCLAFDYNYTKPI